LHWVAGALIQAGLTQEACDVFTEALAAIRSIEDADDYRSLALGEVVQTLTLAGLTQEACDVFTEALAVARSIEDASSRAWALSDVAEALTLAGRTK
jgi:tetratricopeptide (TPR) repeat protein